jgi:excisionase family DNA binding protein
MSNLQTVNDAPTADTDRPRFLTPAEVARLFRVSKMTVYRAIRDGDLPAVPMRGRWAVPARAIDSMERSALARVDVGDGAQTDTDVGDPGDRPRPGANQTGAGSFSTQHMAGYGEDATPAGRSARSGGVR